MPSSHQVYLFENEQNSETGLRTVTTLQSSNSPMNSILSSTPISLESHRVPLSYDLVPHLSKHLSKLPTSNLRSYIYIWTEEKHRADLRQPFPL